MAHIGGCRGKGQEDKGGGGGEREQLWGNTHELSGKKTILKILLGLLMTLRGKLIGETGRLPLNFSASLKGLDLTLAM